MSKRTGKIAYPKSELPPEPPSIEELAYSAFGYKGVCWSRHPLISNSELLGPLFEADAGARIWHPHVHIAFSNIVREPKPLRYPTKKEPHDPILRVETFLGLQPPRKGLLFVERYKTLIESNPRIQLRRSEVLQAEHQIQDIEAEIDELAQNSTETETLELNSGIKTFTFNELKREKHSLRDHGWNLVIRKDIRTISQAMNVIRKKVSQRAKISRTAHMEAVHAAKLRLYSEIRQFWRGSEYASDIRRELEAELERVGIVGEALAASRNGRPGPLIELANAIMDDCGNVYHISDDDLVHVSAEPGPLRPLVPFPLYVPTNLIHEATSEPNVGRVVGEHEVSVFARYAEPAPSSPFNPENFYAIIVFCRTRDGGMYAVVVDDQTWKAALIHEDRLTDLDVGVNFLEFQGTRVIDDEGIRARHVREEHERHLCRIAKIDAEEVVRNSENPEAEELPENVDV